MLGISIDRFEFGGNRECKHSPSTNNSVMRFWLPLAYLYTTMIVLSATEEERGDCAYVNSLWIPAQRIKAAPLLTSNDSNRDTLLVGNSRAHRIKGKTSGWSNLRVTELKEGLILLSQGRWLQPYERCKSI
jgi:hypothetical protein